MPRTPLTHTAKTELFGTLDALQQTGRAHARKARWRHCPGCRLLVIHGPDATLMATLADADPTPLDADDQLACKLAHRPMYLLRRSGDRMELDYVDEWATPGTANRPVLPQHLCGAPRYTNTL